mgnify:CR=1 FL=1|tara:strand:- start:82 stop:255 length:174 start_codon:yes stop_codon:yes gene_type:complete
MVLDTEKMTEDIDLENLDRKEIKKIKRLANLNELNIFYDKNKIISKLCDELLKLTKA